MNHELELTRHDIILKREELYDAVWSEPALKLAAKYGISAVALAKICRKLHVPVPGRGYWAKVEAGHRVPPRPPLRPLRPGQRSAHRLYRFRPHVPLREEIQEAVQHEREPEARIIVPNELTEPHTFIKKSRGRLFRAALTSKEVRLQRPCLDVTVSRQQLDRALRLMDALLKASKDILRWGTHAAPRDVMNLYTSVEWDKLCAEVAKLSIRVRPSAGARLVALPQAAP